MIERMNSVKPPWYGDVAIDSPALKTPMMKQFIELKNKVPDALLLFRMGDFYELFLQDAVDAAEALELTLTSRNKKDPNPVPMAGIPYHALENYLTKLVEENFKIAIAEQEEDPEQKMMVRKITRLVTAGIPWDSDMVEADESCWLGALCGTGPFGLAFLDVSTGEFVMTQVKSLLEATAELLRMDVREIIIHNRLINEPICYPILKNRPNYPATASWFDERSAKHSLRQVLNVQDLNAFGINDQRWAIGAAGAVISYARDTAMVDLSHINRLNYYHLGSQMVMDESTRRNLEVVQPLRGTGKKGTLLGLLDKTCTAMGARLLRQWLISPLLDIEKIERRQQAVSDLLEMSRRRQLREYLRQVYDLERLSTKLAQKKINPRELRALSNSLQILPDIFSITADLSGFVDQQPRSLGQEIAEHIQQILVEEPPTSLTDGNIIAKGNSDELDELVLLSEEGITAIAKMEEEQRIATGITSLKIKYNRVFGYFLEVTNTHRDKAPKDWIRKQTLSNAERYITPELKEFEEKILGAGERRKAIEHAMYVELRTAVAEQIVVLQELAKRVAHIDCISCLAEVAVQYRYVRPSVDQSMNMYIKEARHPVIEQNMPSGEAFVPNDISFTNDRRLIMLTGPNMAGKSTIMRQVALIALLAQIGSYVPAKKAQIGLFDRIFVRVGASDDLTQGRSTFMVEMSETAFILHNATESSLILLDEIGRGTSTFDGLSIAWAVAEAVHDSITARCIFATHYHEMTVLTAQKQRIINLHVAISESKGDIVFLRTLQEGATGKSYGIQCAKLAGMPRNVIKRAKELLKDLERSDPTVQIDQMNLFDAILEPNEKKSEGFDEFMSMLDNLDPDTMTPRDALDALYSIKDFKRQHGL